MGEIAHDLRITVGTLTTAITKLIKKGYVERKRIEEDRRVVLVNLTSKGEEVYKVHQVFHEEMICAMLSNFSDEEEQVLSKSLEKLNTFFFICFRLSSYERKVQCKKQYNQFFYRK